MFNYSLGTSRDSSRSFTAAELTDELGEALLQDYPAQSQLHAFTEPADAGKAWRINQKSLIPPAYVNYQPVEGYRGGKLGRFPGKQPEVIVELSTKDLAGTKFGYFKGVACNFHTLFEAWSECRQPKVRLIPDATDCLPNIKELQHTAMLETWDVFRTYEDICEQILAHLDGKSLIVVALMKGASDIHGLLLVHARIGNIFYWHRIGICRWPSGALPKDDLFGNPFDKELPSRGSAERETLNMNGPSWEVLEGLFG